MHPVLTYIWGYPVHLYAVLIALGFVAGVVLAARYAKQVGVDRDMVLDLCWWLLVMGLVGSRVVFIITNWDQYWYPCVDFEHFNRLYPQEAITERDCTRILRFWNGGLVFYGAVIGSFLTLFWFMRREKKPVLPVGDLLIPYLALGQFFGRLGCLAAGCCWGKPTESAVGVQFPSGSMAWEQHVRDGLIHVRHDGSLFVHPTQLYDAGAGLLLFAFLLWLRHRKRYHGQVFVWWMLIYPLSRSLIELYRGDEDRKMLFEVVSEPLNRFLRLPEGSATFFSTSQFISIGIAAVALVLLFRLRRHRIE